LKEGDSLKINTNRNIRRIILVLILIIIAGIGVLYLYLRSNIYRTTKTIPNTEIQESKSNNESDKEPVYEEAKGITNILIIGTDARQLNENSRSDSMMIATIDSNKKEVRLTSILRDTYVDIKGHGKQKINAAFAYGGAELLMNTLQNTFNIKLDKYAIINFGGFEGVVDAVGGLDINVKSYEVSEINKYIGETDSVKSPMITKAGYQHMDGQQSLSYARIRHVGNGVYERDERQRTVASLLLDKLKTTSVFNYPTLMSKLMPCIKTNIEPAFFLSYAYTVSKFKPLKVEQLQIPLTELSDGRIYNGSWVFLMDKQQNASILNDFVFKSIIPDKKKLNYSSFKRAIDKYLSEEVKKEPKSIPAGDLKKEPYESDHSYP
jgi:LCP family protein required for cell wall assembly